MNEHETNIIHHYLHEIFYYDKEGYLINKKTNNPVNGRLDKVSKKLLFVYCFRLNNKKYNWSLGHLIYFYHHKIKPEYIVHINDNPADNRIENLKSANHSEMMIHSNINTKNKHGYKGVVKDNKRYGARLWTGKSYKYIGWFYTPEEAHNAYLKARESWINK